MCVWVLNIEYSSGMQSGERKHQIYYALLNNLAMCHSVSIKDSLFNESQSTCIVRGSYVTPTLYHIYQIPLYPLHLFNKTFNH